MQKNISDSFTSFEEEDSSEASVLFFEKLINKALGLIPWLLVSVILCVSLAFVYYKLSIPLYTAAATILVQDDKKGSDLGEANVLQDFGLMLTKSNVDNEVEIFKSRTLVEDVVKELQLNVRYYIDGKLKKKELFLNRPVSVYFLDIVHAAPASLEIVLNTHNYSYSIKEDEKVRQGKFGDTLQLVCGKVIVIPEESYHLWNNAISLFVNIGPLNFTSIMYRNSLSVIVPNKMVSVINLRLNETLPERAELVLNKLIESYMRASVNDKNRMADSTVKFIDERLQLVFKELSGIEHDIQDFKINNQINDVGEQAKLLLDNTSEYAKQLTTQEVQLSVVNELETFLKNNLNNVRTVPSSLVMQDPSFVALVNQYNLLELQKDKMLMSQTEKHPSVVTLDEQLKNLRLELLSSISSVKRGIQVSIDELRKRTSAYEGQMRGIPVKERMFLDYSRQQAIKQELYLFLLKKREETAISKSSTIANARIIDSARANSAPISPDRNKILLIGLLLGIIIPFGISYGRDFLNNKVSSLEDIAAYTKAPVLAEIGHNEDDSVIAISETARTPIAEQLRALRTNLQYVLPNEGEKVILVTSSMSGEGKSFLSINLSKSLALAGKKVALLELDLRRPKISENLKLRQVGFTNFIVSNDSNWKQWIQSIGEDDKFDVLSSGPLPPNPSEILMLPKVEKLIDELKQNYDYVIVDTAPIGLVTDAQVIAKQANLTLFVVRHRFTFKQQLKTLEKLHKKNNMPKMNIVVNDIQLKKTAYGYGHGYDYYVYGYESKSPATNKKGKKSK